MKTNLKADLTPQGRYDYLKNKPADIKGFAQAFEHAFEVYTEKPETKDYFLKTGHLYLSMNLLGNQFFVGHSEGWTCLESAYENWLNQIGWDVSYEHPDGIATIVRLKPIKPIKKD